MTRLAPMTELAAQAGVTHKQIEYWCYKGYVKSVTRGAGHDRVIEPAERRILIVMARLVRAGLTARLAAQIARKACDIAEPGEAARIRITRRGASRIAVVIEDT